MSNEQLTVQRNSLLRKVEKFLEAPMIFLGFVWLVLLVVELIWGLTPVLEIISITIWVIFILDFLLKLILAPKKFTYLKKNWLTAISLIIPALRIFRIFRIARLIRGIRSVRLIKVVSSVNRSMGSLNATMKRRGFKYVIILTVAIIFAGAAGMYAFEKDSGKGFMAYGNALWWIRW
jgi:voltage-gated potassium channel